MNFILYENIYLYDFIKIVLGVMVFISFIYSIRLVIEIVLINNKIEKLFRERDEKIKNETSGGGITISGAELIKKYRTEEYEKKIQPLMRRRGYILDILPFVQKK